MLISDSHEFIFLRMRKVASTSMREILRPLCIPVPAGRLTHLRSRAKLSTDYHKHVFRAHEDILSTRRLMPADLFDRYFKFAFVRNPWERLVSEYEFLLKKTEHGRHARVKKLAGFDQFIDMQIPRRDAYQSNMLCDGDGNLLVDFVGKLEQLDVDWKTVCEHIKIDYQALPRKNATQHRRYQDYYTPDNVEKVSQHWAKDIALFGYQFEPH